MYRNLFRCETTIPVAKIFPGWLGGAPETNPQNQLQKEIDCD